MSGFLTLQDLYVRRLSFPGTVDPSHTLDERVNWSGFREQTIEVNVEADLHYLRCEKHPRQLSCCDRALLYFPIGPIETTVQQIYLTAHLAAKPLIGLLSRAYMIAYNQCRATIREIVLREISNSSCAQSYPMSSSPENLCVRRIGHRRHDRGLSGREGFANQTLQECWKRRRQECTSCAP